VNRGRRIRASRVAWTAHGKAKRLGSVRQNGAGVGGSNCSFNQL
jgi:hypothetical protein